MPSADDARTATALWCSTRRYALATYWPHVDRTIRHDRHPYRQRILGCLVLSLLVVLGALHLWPAPSGTGAPADIYSVAARETIDLEQIQPTTQAQRPPPPPPPLVPVVVPDAVELDDVEVDLTDVVTVVASEGPPGEDADAVDGTDAAASARTVDEAPRAFRFVVPEYTQQARERGIQATVQVEVRVDRRGRVEAARIIERMLVDGSGQPIRRVEELGYGLDEAALAAARRWLFRPARKNGEPVASVTTIQLDMGSSRSNS